MREDYVSISPAQLRAGGQQDVDYILDRPPFTRYFWTGRGFEPVSGANTLYTAAQLSAMAAAGTLTPLATYIPSDADPPYQLWARSASEFGPSLGVPSIGFSETKTAVGYTSTFNTGGQSAVLLTLSQASGLLTGATVQLESLAGVVYGIAYFPGPARFINIPTTPFDARCNVVMLSGTSPGVLIGV